MSGAPRRRRRPNRSAKPVPANDLWKGAPEPPPVERVVAPADPTVLLRSLGPPPLPTQAGAADAYLAVVVGRAAGLAVALAAAADLLEEPEDT